MGKTTKIQWCDHTWNPWIGCTKVNEGCKNCYAEFLMDHRYGRVKWGPSGIRSRTKTWKDPVRWNNQARKEGVKKKVFCASLADVFEDKPELVPWRKELFELIDRCQHLYWLLLTKRPENVRDMWPGRILGHDWRENVWLGTSIANQKNADEFVPRLIELQGLAPCYFLSLEPQIGHVDLSEWLFPEPQIDWVIVGGESRQGGEARPFQIRWARDMVQQCSDAGVPCFVKQLGSNVWEGKRRIHLVDSHGGDISEWPKDIRIRQCPENYLVEAEVGCFSVR